MYAISKRTPSSSEQTSLIKLRRTSVVLSGQRQEQHQDPLENTIRTAYRDLLTIARDDSKIYFVDSSSTFGLDLATLNNHQDAEKSSQGIKHYHERATTWTATSSTSHRYVHTMVAATGAVPSSSSSPSCRKCPSGHDSPLAIVPFTEMYQCDICNLYLVSGTKIYCCKKCPGAWTVCTKHRLTQQQAPAPHNDDDEYKEEEEEEEEDDDEDEDEDDDDTNER